MGRSDVSLLKYIAPVLDGPQLFNKDAAIQSGVRNIIKCDPPRYTQVPGFALELDPITSKPELEDM